MFQLSRVVVALCLFAGLLIPARQPEGQAARPQPAGLAPAPASPSPALQFTSAGHVLAFQSDGFYIAAASHALRVKFLGAEPVAPRSSGQQPAPGRLARLGQVSWNSLWPGIDLAYQPAAEGIAESTYQLAAGARLEQIRLEYNRPLELRPDGSLEIAFEDGSLRESAPLAWQTIAGSRRAVPVAYRLLGEREVGFRAAYDPAYPLTIDPAFLWNGFLGGNSNEQNFAIAVDTSGSVYLGGTCDHSWWNPVRAYSGGVDGCIVKFNSSGSPQWNTFLGGADFDAVTDIAVDNGGALYVSGTSRASWGSPVLAYSGGDDAFVAKLGVNGALQLNTFLGSNSSDSGFGVAVDAAGYLYAAGESWGSFGSPVQPYGGGSSDGFVVKLAGNNLSLQWLTFVGGSGQDVVNALRFDGNGFLDLAGASRAAWGAAPKSPFVGPIAAFIAQINASSGALVWNTFYGSGKDSADKLAVDASGNIYASGPSGASWGSPQRSFSGTTNYDIAVVKLNASGARQWNTFLGGVGGSYGSGIGVDGAGSVWVDSWGSGSWGSPTVNGDHAWLAKLNSGSGSLVSNRFFCDAAAHTSCLAMSLAVDANGLVYLGGEASSNVGTPVFAYSGGGSDFLAVKVNSNTSVAWTSIWGGSDDDYAYAVAQDSFGDLFVVGNSSMTWGNPLEAFHGGTDAYLVVYTANGVRAWMTFIGGPGYDYGKAVTVGNNGIIYVAGYTTGSWGTPTRPFTQGDDGFVAAYNTLGGLSWNTFLGGTADDYILSIDRDPASGALFVGGFSSGTWGSPAVFYSAGYDAFAARVNSNGQLGWNTFLGGSGQDTASGVVVANSALYVSGSSDAFWGSSPARGYSGGTDGFVARLSLTNGARNLLTYLGGAGEDYTAAIAADSTGVIHVAGYSSASWGFPTRAFSGGEDGFVAALNGLGGLGQVAFLGGSGWDEALALAIDNQNNLYVGGYSTAGWGSPALPYAAKEDGFLAVVSPSGQLTHNTFLGGAESDYATAVVVGPNRDVTAVGYSNGSWSPPNQDTGSYFSGGYDGFVVHEFFNDTFLPTIRR